MARGSQGARQKHVPERTCVACGKTSDKRGLLRIVRTPAGTLEVDERGKKPGRGAYLCLDTSCWTQGLKRKRLDQALRVTLSIQDRETLREQAERLLQAKTA